jgi:hypothetical protein
MQSLPQFRIPGSLALIFVLAGTFPLQRALADACPPDVRIPVGYSVDPPMPCVGGDAEFVIQACAPCVTLISAEPLTNEHVRVRVRMEKPMCVLRQCRVETLSVPLRQLNQLRHTVKIEVIGEVVLEDSSVCTVAQQDTFSFRLGRCPIPTPLPYVDDIVVGRRVVCVTDPCPDLACAGDSIPVLIRGTFPTDCFSLRRIELEPSAVTVIGPPKLRILIDDGACLDRPCAAVPVPWSAKVMLPPLPLGDYRLPVELGIATCTDSFPADSLLYRRPAPFIVADACTIPSRPCFRVDWMHPSQSTACDAFVSPGNPGQIVLLVAPDVALAGLQGELVFDQPGLRIANLEPLGYASGMHLDWRRTERGARFVLFAEQGAPIPPCVFCENGWELLRVTVEATGQVPVQPTRVFVGALVASDSAGIGVPVCPDVRLDLRRGALICPGARCDINADGIADVRDLVLMVRCVLNTGPCPDTTAIDLDCNHDGLIELEDVLCCAQVILNGDVPDSTGGRPETAVGVDFGDVQREEVEVALPVFLHGAERVGAARLALSYPADRFDVSAVELPSAPGWLALHQVRDGKVVIGLIATSEVPAGPSTIEMVLHLALKPGQNHGGQVRVVESQFSGRDGVGLLVDLGQPWSTLPIVTPIALSPGNPNPFSGTTRFTVDLAAAGDLEIGVYDLTGRKVAELFHGKIAAGSHDFVWDGTRSDGGEIPSGVYFVRAARAGRVASSKVVLIRDH